LDNIPFEYRIIFRSTHLLQSNYYIEVGNDLWDGFTGREACKNKQTANVNSYDLIETFHNDFATRGLEFGNSLEQVDAITRIMAR